MRAPVDWLRDYVALPSDLSPHDLATALVRAGLEVERVEQTGSDLTGPLVVGRVLELAEEPQRNGKTIRWCSVDVGEDEARGIVCGAANFAAGDLVVVALPGAVLPGDFAIAARKTYGHVSDGMICSARELGAGDDHAGIMVLPPEDGVGPGADAIELLGLRADVLDIAVTPDRGYCFSMRGLAREAAQATGSAFTDPVDRQVPLPDDSGYPVRLDAPACPLFVAVSVIGIEPDRSSPRWLTRRLRLAGMRSISLTVDIANYVMLETGQPVHTYDADRLEGPLVVRLAEEGEKLATLDGTVRALDIDDLLVTDGSGPIGLAGVMGGASTEITGSTRSVVIEAAYFDAITIARTSRRHKLSSEASRRFERGVDPVATYAAAHRVAALLVELAGGTLVADETVAGRLPAVRSSTFAAGLPERVLGTPVDRETVVALLEAVGASVEERVGNQFELVGGDDDVLTVAPPTWRPDLTDPYDFVEEVGRLVGYDTIEPVVPLAPPGRGLTRAQRDRRAVRARVTDAGCVEVWSLPFVGVDELDRLGLPPDDDRRALVEVLNPLSETTPFLRTTLLPGLLGVAVRNLSRGIDDLALLEIGPVFLADDPLVAAPRPPVTRRPSDAELAEIDAALGRQPRHLGVVLSGQWRPAGWSGPADAAGWAQAIGIVEAAADAVAVTLVRRAAERAPWHPGRCAELSVDGVVVGYAGELHPTVCRAWGLPPRTAAAEVDLDALIAAAPPRGAVVAVSSFPVAKEDVALVVDVDVPVAAVESALRAGAGPLLESVTLFDVYTSEQIGVGKRSLAFALRFRAPDRTLTDAETAGARDAAAALAHERTGAVQRVLGDFTQA